MGSRNARSASSGPGRGRGATGSSKKTRVLESKFQSDYMREARMLGWKVWHFHDSRRQVGGRFVGDKDAKGWVDLVLVRNRPNCDGSYILFRELKRDGEDPTEAQVECGEALLAAGQDWAVRRAEDWPLCRRELE